eukprot:TRINITY_DN2576_c0_g1_i18.p1 TRINITY_DN2576_c0_g1~~TRINITY_DN2576_c0_g1_i18.p1  ORF type:complete len:584 (+),score=78.87 TRINITY_DN2576_c0_g1_i18:2552-4303(+)
MSRSGDALSRGLSRLLRTHSNVLNSFVKKSDPEPSSATVAQPELTTAKTQSIQLTESITSQPSAPKNNAEASASEHPSSTVSTARPSSANNADRDLTPPASSGPVYDPASETKSTQTQSLKVDHVVRIADDPEKESETVSAPAGLVELSSPAFPRGSVSVNSATEIIIPSPPIPAEREPDLQANSTSPSEMPSPDSAAGEASLVDPTQLPTGSHIDSSSSASASLPPDPTPSTPDLPEPVSQVKVFPLHSSSQVHGELSEVDEHTHEGRELVACDSTGAVPQLELNAFSSSLDQSGELVREEIQEAEPDASISQSAPTANSKSKTRGPRKTKSERKDRSNKHTKDKRSKHRGRQRESQSTPQSPVATPHSERIFGSVTHRSGLIVSHNPADETSPWLQSSDSEDEPQHPRGKSTDEAEDAPRERITKSHRNQLSQTKAKHGKRKASRHNNSNAAETEPKPGSKSNSSKGPALPPTESVLQDLKKLERRRSSFARNDSFIFKKAAKTTESPDASESSGTEGKSTYTKSEDTDERDVGELDSMASSSAESASPPRAARKEKRQGKPKKVRQFKTDGSSLSASESS